MKYITLNERLRGINEETIGKINEAFASRIIADMHDTRFATNWSEINKEFPLAWDKIKDSDLVEMTADDIYIRYERMIFYFGRNSKIEKGDFYKRIGSIKKIMELVKKQNELDAYLRNEIYSINDEFAKFTENTFDIIINYNGDYLDDEVNKARAKVSPEKIEEYDVFVTKIKNRNSELKSQHKQLEDNYYEIKRLESYVWEKDEYERNRKIQVHPTLFCLNASDELVAIICNSEVVWLAKKRTGNPYHKDVNSIIKQGYNKFYFLEDATPFFTDELRRKRKESKEGALALEELDKIAARNKYHYEAALEGRKSDKKLDELINIKSMYALYNVCVSISKNVINNVSDSTEIDSYNKINDFLEVFKNVNNKFKNFIDGYNRFKEKPDKWKDDWYVREIENDMNEFLEYVKKLTSDFN